MENLVADDLTIEVGVSQPGVVRLDWKGKSNARQPGVVLGPFCAQVVDLAANCGSAIEMHFEQLQHFNSSTITALIQLIQDLRDRNIRLTVVFNGSLKWQKLSFDALRVLEKPDGLLTFRAVGN